MGAWFPQQNPTLDKVGLRLNLAGSAPWAPILSGLAATLTIEVGVGENFRSATIRSDDGFSKILSVSGSGRTRTASVVFGVDTDSGASAVRNVISVRTNRGTVEQQFWVRDLPSTRSLYVNNVDAQGQLPVLYADDSATEEFNRAATFSLNVLPNLVDEFFDQQHYQPNRWAQTLRHWGGAATAEVFLDGEVIVPEGDVADVHGYFWPEPSYATHQIRVRLRAASGSAHYVDVDGRIRVMRIPCP